LYSGREQLQPEVAWVHRVPALDREGLSILLRGGKMKMGRIVKIVILAGLVIAVSYLFGTICWRVRWGYELIFIPSLEAGGLVAWWLMGTLAVTILASLVAALVRPLWVCGVTFLLASPALLLGWEVSVGTGLLALLYFLALLLYTVKTARELEARVRFSVRALSDGFPILLAALALIACGGIYFGYAAQIEAEGFSIPPSLKDTFVETIMQRVSTQMEAEAELKPEDREKQLAEIREQMESMWLEPIESRLKPYEPFIPALLALSVFWTLRTLLVFVGWIPALVLRVLFSLLTALGVTRVVRETREVERLVME